MPSLSPPISVVLLAMPSVTASTLFGIYDLFRSVGRDWQMVTTGRPGPGHCHVQIVAAEPPGFRAANEVWIQPDCGLEAVTNVDIVWVPEVLVAPDEDPSGQFDAEIAFLRRCHQNGAIIATACSGALLLAEAGLLAGQDATSHWAYCDALARRYPDVRMHADRALVVTGTGQRLVMAGGGTSWMDVALYLIARTVDIDEAMRMARLYLIDWHGSGQQPYATLARVRQVDDPIIARCQQWIANHYDEPAPVAGMARLSGLAERTFVRRFTEATGYRPLEYVHTLRLEEAKQMLEISDLPIEVIACEVGYEDASFFGRLFRRRVGMTPGSYRKRFGSLRALLQDAPGAAASSSTRNEPMASRTLSESPNQGQ
jgi:transcriptional regulator GlxA family with amidase domain